MKLENVIIRRVTHSDVRLLEVIGKHTFEESFSSENSEDDMKAYLEHAFSAEKLTSELNNEFSEFYFAELEGEVIGYLKVNFGGAQTEMQEDKSLEIERIYVVKDYHGKKVGQLLFEKALAIAKSKNFVFVWLGVWERNPRAIRFYEKNGFVAFDKHTFKLGGDTQTDVMMKLKISK